MSVISSTSIQLHSIAHLFPAFTNCWYLVDYIPKQYDRISRSLLNYKKNKHRCAYKWNHLAANRLAALQPDIDITVRALGSNERRASKKISLDSLGELLAERLHCKYFPELLFKTGIHRPLHFLGRSRRIVEMHDMYYMRPYARNDTVKFLIIDDLVTTGTTMNAIRAAILTQCPNAQIYFFTLGKTLQTHEHNQEKTDQNPAKVNDHLQR